MSCGICVSMIWVYLWRSLTSTRTGTSPRYLPVKGRISPCYAAVVGYLPRAVQRDLASQRESELCRRLARSQRGRCHHQECSISSRTIDMHQLNKPCFQGRCPHTLYPAMTCMSKDVPGGVRWSDSETWPDVPIALSFALAYHD